MTSELMASMRGIVLPLLLFGVSWPSAGAQEADAVTVDAATERIIKRGLRYLAKYQSPNGSWLGRNEKERHYPIAMTSYALMAFQAAGHLPGEGEYGKEVSLGVDYLLNSVSPEGLIGDRNNGQYMYFHGISAITLAELYGQTSNPSIRPKLESMVKIIVSSQNQRSEEHTSELQSQD